MDIDKKLSKAIWIAISVFAVSLQSWGVPSFARTTKLSCIQCHNNFPQLNSFGRVFLQNGYVRTDEVEDAIEINETLSLSHNPFSAFFKLRPYDQKKNSDGAKMRSFHEVEIFIAGTTGNVLGKNVSYFIEIEGEDEESFELEVGPFELGYHVMPELNFLAGNRSLAATDPLQTLSNHGKVTRSSRAIFDMAYGDTMETQGPKQNIGVDGIIANSIIYGAKYGSDVNDPEGEGIEDAEDIELRLAYLLDIEEFGGVSLGGYYKDGSQIMGDGAGIGTGTNLNFNRIVIDAMVDSKFGRYILAVQRSEDDLFTGGSVENLGFYAEASYGFQKDDKPFIVPTVRLDQYERADGAEDYSELTLNLAYFLRENMKVFLEYWQELDVPSSDEDHRVTLQIEIGI